jgi:hypothetical protein
MKRENDEAERKLRDEIDKEKKETVRAELEQSSGPRRLYRLPPTTLSCRPGDGRNVRQAARTPTTHGNRTPPSRCKYQGHPDKLDLILTNTQEELEKLRHRYRGVVTQTDTKSETAFASS